MFYLQTGHVCDTPGCGSVLVLDGNMKNCRQVCACRDIGELKFAALQGSVVVGVYFSLEFFFSMLFRYHYVDRMYCMGKLVSFIWNLFNLGFVSFHRLPEYPCQGIPLLRGAQGSSTRVYKWWRTSCCCWGRKRPSNCQHFEWEDTTSR